MSPITDGAGHSKSTPIKQERFRMAAGHLLGAASAVMERSNWCDTRLLVIDLTAGPGAPSGEPGSPLILARLLSALGSGPKADLLLCEKRQATLSELTLQARAIENSSVRTHVLPGDHRESVPRWIASNLRSGRPRLGLVYFDPNGCQPLPIELYAELGRDKRTERLDLLLSVPATAWKRNHMNGKLATAFEAIPKQHKFVAGRYGRGSNNDWGWTFVIATDWAKARAPRDFAKLGSPEADEILWRATHMRSEWHRDEDPPDQLRLDDD